MNFIPRELLKYLDDYKKIHKKILQSVNFCGDIKCVGTCKDQFDIDLRTTNFSSEVQLNLILRDIFISFKNESGFFLIECKIITKNGKETETGTIYSGRYNTSLYRTVTPIGINIKLTEPSIIRLNFKSPEIIETIVNADITVNN